MMAAARSCGGWVPAPCLSCRAATVSYLPRSSATSWIFWPLTSKRAQRCRQLSCLSATIMCSRRRSRLLRQMPDDRLEDQLQLLALVMGSPLLAGHPLCVGYCSTELKTTSGLTGIRRRSSGRRSCPTHWPQREAGSTLQRGNSVRRWIVVSLPELKTSVFGTGRMRGNRRGYSAPPPR